MALSLILALQISTTKQPSAAARKVEVAFIAHVYPKDSKHDDGHLRVYVCGLHGEGLKELPGICGAGDVGWLDSNQVAWFAAPDIDSRGSNREMIYDLRTGKTKVIPFANRRLAPLEFDESHGRIRRFKGPSDPNNRSVTSLDKGNPARFEFGEARGSWTLTRLGVTKSFNFLDGEAKGLCLDARANRVWFYDWNHVSSGGTWMALYYFDWNSNHPVKVFNNAADFDFSPDRETYAAVENFHLPLQATHRWPKYARAWVGNWKTGQRWWITDKNLLATSIALRPRP